MARIDIIIAKLPALIADRADSLKLETAIRYVGDIIFDASQNRSGDKAKALAKVLSAPASPEEAQSRDAILTLFRDGYLDRYADYTALREIALAAGISDATPFIQESATADAPRVVVLTGMLNAPTASVKAAAERPERVKSAEALKLSTPTPRKDEPTRRLKTVIEAASNEATGERVAQAPRESGGLQRARQAGEARVRTKSATSSLEITSLESTDRSPLEFAKKFKKNPADKLSEMGFPCLVGFVPKISADERSVEWANPITADSFRDYGHQLTSGSPSRLAIRAMLELARADNWTSVAVKGTVRLQAFTEATAAELDRLFPVSPGRGTADRSFHEVPRLSSVGPKRRRLRRAIATSASLLVLIQMGFGAAYIYSNPQLQTRLGIKSFIDTLPWKHEEVPAKARENALEFSRLTLALSTRTGTALAPPQAQFKDTDLTNARYLKWTATFKNLLAGVEGHDEKVEARFYDPNGLQIASSTTSAFVWPSHQTADFSGVALMPPMTDKPAGTYRVALYAGDKMLTQESFQVNQNLSARKAAPAAQAPAAATANVPNAETRAGNPFREPEMVVVPAGSFTMGSPSSEVGRFGDESPQHQVTIGRPFAVGKYPVTRDEYGRFVEANGHSSDEWKNSSFPQNGRDPVVNVNWDDAKAYVAWLSQKTGHSYRLLSESEYEYAQRAGTTTAYWWGDNADQLCSYANGDPCHHHGTVPVGSYPANAFGLYDMAGNVWEWTEDCWNESYAGASADGTAWTAGDCGQRILRGGSWYDYDARALRSALRNRLSTGFRYTNIGFRVARTLLAAPSEAPAAAAAKEEQRKRDEEARKLAMVDERRAKGGPQSPDIGRPPPLQAAAGCELWRGRFSGNDPTVMVEARFCSDQQGHVTGVVQVSYLKSGYALSEVEGRRAPNGDFFLHDVRFREDHPVVGRWFCFDRYALTPEGPERLVGSYVSQTCHENGQVDLTRMGPSALPPPAPEARETTNTYDTSKESVADAGVPYTATPCKVCYNAQNGHYYRYVSAPAITWHEAEAQAAAVKYRGSPGYLATVTSTEEFNFINSVVFSAANFPSGIPANVYVGGSDNSTPGTWKWVTGPEGAENSGAGLIFYSSDSVQNGLIAPWDSHDSQGQIDGSTGEYYLALNGWFEPGFSVLSGTALGTVYAGGNSGYLIEYSKS